MSRIPVHTVDDAPDDSTQILAAIAKGTGKVLNIHGEMAHSPVVIAAYNGIVQAIRSHGTFDGRTREAIALAAGAVNSCDYCQAAHTISAKIAGLTEEQTIAIRSGDEHFDARLAPLLAVVRQAASEVGEVDDATWQSALDAGWSEGELTEAFAHIMANQFTNYFNHYARTELDVPAAPPL